MSFYFKLTESVKHDREVGTLSLPNQYFLIYNNTDIISFGRPSL